MKAKHLASGSAVARALALFPLLLPSAIAMRIFTPLPCNIDLTVADCTTITLSSILDAAAVSNPAAAAVIPCGTCAIADLGGATLEAPHGLDVEGMLYFPPATVGVLEAAHIIVQGILKIDPPSPPGHPEGRTNGQVTVRLTGPASDVMLIPHAHNAMACGPDGCNVGKRPIAVAGGRLDIQGVRDVVDEDGGAACPAWVPLRSAVPWELGTFFPRITGGEYDSSTGEICGGTSLVGCYDNGDSVTYDEVDFGTSDAPAVAIKISYSKYKTSESSYVEASSNGQLLGTFHPTETYSWSNFKEKVFHLDVLLEGVHPLTLTAKHGGGVCNIAWFELSAEDATTALKLGARAAACWEATDGGDILLTNAAYRNGWRDHRVLSVSETDAADGTVLVDKDVNRLGNPPTEETEPMMAAEVASLSRPVVFQSVRDGPERKGHTDLHGGHLMIFHTPHVQQKLEGVEIVNFGQQGNLGRYPVHFHHCGNVAGSVVKNNVIRDSLQRCIVVHGSDAVLVENNVAYNTFGHCFITEDGGETDNTFKDNLGAKTRNAVLSIGASDKHAATFWVTDARNHFIGNVAAGSDSSGFWFEILGSPEMYTFERNVAHNNQDFGMQMYPKGYAPDETVFFDDLKLYNNGKAGIKMKRTARIQIRNAFFAENTISILFLSNFGGVSVTDSIFHAVAPRLANSRCVDGAIGINFNLEKGSKQLKLTDSSFHGYGNVPDGCDGPGVALKLEEIEPAAMAKSDENFEMIRLYGVTFDSPKDSFGIHSGEFVNKTIILEDRDGAMNPSGAGVPGFYVQDEAPNTAFLEGRCVGTTGVGSSEVLYCEGVCLRRVYIDTACCSSTDEDASLPTDVRLVLTSRTDGTTYTYDKRHVVTTDKKGFVRQDNERFDIALPADAYDYRLLDFQTGERLYTTVSIEFEQTSCVGHVTEDSFHTDTITFPLYVRNNADDLIDQSGVTVGNGKVSYFDHDDYMTYNNVNFGSSGDSARIRIKFASGRRSKGKVEVRLGDQTGQKIGTFYPWNTGGWSTTVETTFAIDSTVEGLQRVTLVGKDGGGIMNLYWFELAPPVDPASYSIHARVQAENVLAEEGVNTGSIVSRFDRNDYMLYDDVWFGNAGETTKMRVRFSKGIDGGRMDVYLDGINGKKIGSFTPWRTGKRRRDWSIYVEGTFNIDEDIEGLHKIAFVGEGRRGILNLDWFQLEGNN